MTILNPDNKLFERCAEIWGVENQAFMTIEEIGEVVEQLGKTISKMNKMARCRIDGEELVEEFVDLYLMMQQMRWLNRDIFDRIYDKKVNLILERLEEHERSRSNNQ